MVLTNDERVIWDVSQSENYYTATKTLILSDSSESPPGYALLELLTPTMDKDYQLACVRMNDRLYISSSLVRKRVLLYTPTPGYREHGPSASCKIDSLEFDIVIGFACDFWPPSASPWIRRCQSWPDKEVVDSIVKNGCHFVPVGNPLGIHEHEEWRISFSLAEHKLVYTMNHCQFLTYGLLKIFLKEVINTLSTETNELLCSYHIKTAVLWVVQSNAIPVWCPQNILVGFWICFKLLLKWVYEGVCPNFFIPENNLFLSKIYGPAQMNLFLELHGLYEKGLACLLRSTSIKSDITNVLYNPRLSLCTNEDGLKSELDYDIELFKEVFINTCSSTETDEPRHCITFLHTVEHLIGLPLTQFEVPMLQRLTVSVLQNTAFALHNMYTDTGLNKQRYLVDKMSCYMLKLAANFGYISDMVYIVIYYYKTFRYWRALSVLEIIKVKLAQSGLMYRNFEEQRRFIEVVGGQSWSTKMRQAVAQDIKLDTSICDINELTLEYQSALQNCVSTLHIPLLVMLHFVGFLCYIHNDTTSAKCALEKLHDLVYHDQGRFIWDQLRDISWQILGICQQITGNHRAALYSYQQSLRQFPFNGIQTATHMRIQELHIT